MKNYNFEFLGSKSKNIKSPRNPFCRALHFTPFWVFRLRLTSKLNIPAAFKHLPFFDPKWWNMTSLKRHFLKHFSTDFCEILIADVKLMLGEVLIVSRRYLPLFLSYRESPAGGFDPPPPFPVGRVLTTRFSEAWQRCSGSSSDPSSRLQTDSKSGCQSQNDSRNRSRSVAGAGVGAEAGAAVSQTRNSDNNPSFY